LEIHAELFMDEMPQLIVTQLEDGKAQENEK
jgi:hypothetical protein